MSRKTIILTATVTLLAIIAASATFYFLSFKNVTFAVKKSDLTASIYTSKDRDRKNKITDIKNNDIVRLQQGEYQAIPNSSTYDTTPIYFTVDKNDITVAVEPSFSVSYLHNLLTKELPNIHAALTKTYPFITTSYTTGEGKLYKEGEWYATTLTQRPADPREGSGDLYYAILLKKNGIWQVIGKPSIVLTTKEFKEVPEDIVKNANLLAP